jgi:hypothetical protein
MRSTGVAGLHLPERAGWLRARHLMDMEGLEGKKLVVQIDEWTMYIDRQVDVYINIYIYVCVYTYKYKI